MVFCLGLSHTGTRSVHTALQRLGLRSVHYPLHLLQRAPDGGWRLDWDSLGRVDAVSDIVTLPYLDAILRRFPGAKLIWTPRNVDTWVAACSAHVPIWKRGIAIDRDKAAWLRERVYGHHDPTPEQFRRAYANWDARIAMAQRTHALLRLPVTAGADWTALCSFLGADVPNVPFPHIGDAPRVSRGGGS